MASIANDKAMINELMYGEKDLHTLTAKIVFPEIPKDMPADEVKVKFHDHLIIWAMPILWCRTMVFQ